MSESTLDVKAIFARALEFEAAEDRATYLQEACGQNVELRARVEQLLTALNEAGSFMREPAAGPAEPGQTTNLPISERPGVEIGHYKLMEQIGEGGFGLVFVAEQQRPVRRKVALKVIKPGMDTRDVVARFEAEKQALALMDHPHIARVFDAGATESGRPYFVMELVRGIPITEYFDQEQLGVRERLELFASVCQAIQHAHQKGIIHRDVKPSNVLVSSHDGRPVVKVIDFGVAKALNQQLAQQTIYTRFAQMIGTPLYMSPEQAAMSGLDVDTRSDIYSLGVLLYELLTGSPPIERERLAQAAFDELRRIIREEEPPKPSTRLTQSGERLASIAAQRRTEPARLSKLIRGELDWIVMKALEKDRTRRYETAAGFAADIERYLADEPVEACPPSLAYKVRKFARRNKAAVASTVMITAALVLGIAISTWQAIRAVVAERRAQDLARQALSAADSEKNSRDAEAAQRKQAERERQRAEEAEQQASLERDNAVAEKKRAEELGQRAVDETELKRRHLYASHVSLAHQAYEQGLLPSAVGLLEKHRSDAAEGDSPTFEWHYLWRRCQSRRLEIDAGCGTVQSLRFAPDGKSIYVKGADYSLRKYDTRSGNLDWSVKATAKRNAVDLMLAPDADSILSREMAGVALYDTKKGERLATRGEAEGEIYLWPDGRSILTGSGGTWKLIDVRDGATKRELKLPADFSWCVSADGKRLAGIANRKKVAILNLESQELKQFEFDDPGYWTDNIAISPDGILGVIGTWAHDVHFLREVRTATGASITSHSEGGGSIPVKECSLYDLGAGGMIGTGRLVGHGRGITAVTFSPVGSFIATASIDGTVRLWYGDSTMGVIGWHETSSTAVAFSADTQELASGGHDGKIKIWSLDTKVGAGVRQGRAWLGDKAQILDLAISPDGKTVAAAGRKDGIYGPGAVWLLDARTGELQKTFDEKDGVTGVAFHPTRPLLAWACEKTVTLWNVENGEVHEKLDLLGGSPGSVRFSRDGLLIATDSRRTVLWDLTAQKQRCEIDYDTHGNQCPVPSPVDDRVAFGDWSSCEAHLFSLSEGIRLATLGNRWPGETRGPNGKAEGEDTAKGAFSADGRLFALPARTNFLDGAGKVELIALDGGKPQAMLSGQGVEFLCVAFSPDGHTVATGTRDGTVIFWDPITGEQRMRLAAHQSQVSSLAFTSDGTLLVSAAWDGAVAFHRAK